MLITKRDRYVITKRDRYVLEATPKEQPQLMREASRDKNGFQARNVRRYLPHLTNLN